MDDILKLEEEKIEELLIIKSITPDNSTFTETLGGFANLKFLDKEFSHVIIIRLFPFSAKNKYLSVRANDDKREEIGIIENLSLFDEKTVELIERQLERRYFIPKIIKIISIKEEFGHAYWTVMTDRGKCKFTSWAGSAGSVIQNNDRVIIRDSNANRYEIPDINKLTQKELKKLDLYL